MRFRARKNPNIKSAVQDNHDVSDLRMASFNLAVFQSYLDLDQLKFYTLALTPDGGILAIATATHLLITDDKYITAGAHHGDTSVATDDDFMSPDKWTECPSDGMMFSTVETVLEFSQQSGRCTALTWLGESNIICVGFESGDFACFDVNGHGIVEQRCDNSPIVSFKLTTDSLPDDNDSRADKRGGGSSSNSSNSRNSGSSSSSNHHKQQQQQQKQSAGNEDEEPSLWILYENSLVAVVPVQSLLLGEFDSLIRFQLLNTEACSALLILPHAYVFCYTCSSFLSFFSLLFRSIRACLYSLTPHGISLTIIQSLPQSSIDTILTITYYLTGTRPHRTSSSRACPLHTHPVVVVVVVMRPVSTMRNSKRRTLSWWAGGTRPWECTTLVVRSTSSTSANSQSTYFIVLLLLFFLLFLCYDLSLSLSLSLSRYIDLYLPAFIL
jgi:hypothetical protein